MYALWFARAGLSAAQISSLFVIWSLTSFVLEVPTGPWADLVSRRRLLALAPLLGGAGFALWTFLPCYLSFAAGFVLWGAGSALRSGTFQALVYEELDRAGRPEAFAGLVGRASSISTVGVLVANAAAVPVLRLGGYQALGIASMAAAVVTSAIGRTFPDPPREPAEEGSYVAVLREALREVRSTPPLRDALIVASAVAGLSSFDEYLPLLVAGTGVAQDAVPLLLALISAAMAVGGWLAGRGERHAAPVLALGAAVMGLGAATGRPWGLAGVAFGFATLQWAIAVTEARLQQQITTDRARATVTSLAGLGAESGALTAFAGYGIGSTWAGPGLLFACCALPLLVIAWAVRRKRP